MAGGEQHIVKATMLKSTIIALAFISLVLPNLPAATTMAIAKDDSSVSSGTGTAQRRQGNVILKARDRAATTRPNVSGTTGADSHCSWRGQTIPCYYEGGWWSSPESCYVIVVSSDPTDGHPNWDDQKDGYLARCQEPGSDHAFVSFWRPALPPKDPPPAVLANQAVESMGIKKIGVGVTPKNGGTGLVGLPVWMWVDNRAQNTYTTKNNALTRTATATVTSVTGHGYVDKIVWDMGDGTTVTCTNPGTVYDKSFGGRPSPTCGHNYYKSSNRQPGNRYTIRATTYWIVDWEETSGGGQSGQIQLQLESSTTRAVGELQVLVR